MKISIALIAALLVSACATTPATAARHIEGVQPQKREIVCSGGAMVLIAFTKPWGLKDCVSGEDK